MKKDKKIFILSIAIIFLLIIIRIFCSPLIAGDEFINYYNTLKIFEGQRMWEEVNIITTPFIYLIGCAFFKIFGTKFIVYRIFNVIINGILFVILYKTFRNLNINKKSSLIYTSILEIPIISYVILWGVTYNVIAMIFCLIGLNLTLKKNEIKRYNLWQGLIMFFVIFTKHNIGLYYAVAQIIIELIIEKKWKKITNLLKQFSIVLIGMICFITILYKNNLLIYFIDMAIIGLSEFTSNIEISMIPFFTTFGTIILLSILIFTKKYDVNNKDNIIILSILGIMMLLMAFPIADSWHMILASIILYIELIYVLDFDGIKLTNNKILIGIDIYLILFISLNVLHNVYSINNNIFEFDSNKDSVFYMTFVKKPQKINNVGQFIKNKKVLIISPEAGIYNLKFNLKSNGFFDEPFNGNLGSNQEEKMIKKLDEYNDSYILIHTKKAYNQEVEELRNYIINNYNKIEEIEDFSVYKK